MVCRGTDSSWGLPGTVTVIHDRIQGVISKDSHGVTVTVPGIPIPPNFDPEFPEHPPSGGGL